MQAEAVCALVAGTGTFFPLQPTHSALLLACMRKQSSSEVVGAVSPYFAQYVHGLMDWLGAQRLVSSLVVPESPGTATNVLLASVPKALSPAPMSHHEVQNSLCSWLLNEVEQEAKRSLSAPPARNVEPSPCLRLLATVMQELLTRASLCSSDTQPQNTSLIQLSEQLLSRATTVLSSLYAPTEEHLAALHATLAPTFLGSLLPWLVDALALFSAFPFEHSWRLLPALLSLLDALRQVLAVDTRQSEVHTSTGIQNAQAVQVESSHPYASPGAEARRSGKDKKLREPVRLEEKHEWLDASQLTLKFDRRCCLEEGDWLTLRFSKGGVPVPGRTTRLCGPWHCWPRHPIAVPADTVHVEFVHAAHSKEHEPWGYSFSVVASKRGTSVSDMTPTLSQLQRSLLYLGAKFATLLVSAEPVTEAEKENRHWLQSPLFVRGLPLQLPADHALMNPFFGIKPVDDEAAGAASAAVAFLDDLASLGGGGGTKLHRHMVATTPELQVPLADAGGSHDAARNAELAEAALLASLLSYNGLLADAQKAADTLGDESSADSGPGVSPPPSPPSEPATPDDDGSLSAPGTDTAKPGSPPAADALAEPTEEDLAELAELEELMHSMEATEAEAVTDPLPIELSQAASLDTPVEGPPAASAASAVESAGGGEATPRQSQGSIGSQASSRSSTGGIVHGLLAAASSRLFTQESEVMNASNRHAGNEPRPGPEWSVLRQQWSSARSLFQEVQEAYTRTLGPEQAAADQGEGLLKLMQFVLMVAQQQQSQSTVLEEDTDMQQLGASLRSGVKQLFRNLFRSRPRTESSSSGRKIEQEIRDWVTSRVAPEQLGQLMYRQQCRAYSRAAGFHATCELLRATEGSPPLQCKLLSVLAKVLRPTSEEGSSSALCSHYSRDVACSGSRASGRLRLAFAATLEQLVKLISANVWEQHADQVGRIPVHHMLALSCVLHMEVREDDLPIQRAVGLLPTLHALVRKAHGATSALEDDVLDSQGGDFRQRWQRVETGDLRHSRVLQLVHHAIITRSLSLDAMQATSSEQPRSLTRSNTSRILRANQARNPQLRRAESSNQGSGSNLQQHLRQQLEIDILAMLRRDVDDVASELQHLLSDERATVLGADTTGDGWATAERFLHGSLAMLFQLLVCRPDGASMLSVDGWLQTLFRALHVSSPRCARLVLRTLARVLPLRSPADLPVDMYKPPDLSEEGVFHTGPLHVRSSTTTTAASNASETGEPLSLTHRFVDALAASNTSVAPFVAFMLMLIAGELAEREVPCTLLSCSVLWRNAHAQNALANDVTALLRALAVCPSWTQQLHSSIRSALSSVPSVVACLKESPDARSLAQNDWRDALRAMGALCVLGGDLPSLHVGCRVSVSAANVSGGRSGREEGMLARWDGAEDSEALVLLDSQLSELRLVAVSALRLLPIDDVPAPVGTFPLSADIVPCFEAFLPSAVAAGEQSSQTEELQASYMFGALQTRALKALQGMLVHRPSSKCVLDYGLLPAIMASAATPVPLVGIHQTEVLQTRVALLEQMHREAASAARCAKEHFSGQRLAVRQRRSTQSTSFVQPPQPLETTPEPLRAHVQALAEMGFALTLCQRAVGMHGEDMAAAVAWLTSSQVRTACVAACGCACSAASVSSLLHAPFVGSTGKNKSPPPAPPRPAPLFVCNPMRALHPIRRLRRSSTACTALPAGSWPKSSRRRWVLSPWLPAKLRWRRSATTRTPRPFGCSNRAPSSKLNWRKRPRPPHRHLASRPIQTLTMRFRFGPLASVLSPNTVRSLGPLLHLAISRGVRASIPQAARPLISMRCAPLPCKAAPMLGHTSITCQRALFAVCAVHICRSAQGPHAAERGRCRRDAYACRRGRSELAVADALAAAADAGPCDRRVPCRAPSQTDSACSQSELCSRLRGCRRALPVGQSFAGDRLDAAHCAPLGTVPTCRGRPGRIFP